MAILLQLLLRLLLPISREIHPSLHIRGADRTFLLPVPLHYRPSLKLMDYPKLLSRIVSIARSCPRRHFTVFHGGIGSVIGVYVRDMVDPIRVVGPFVHGNIYNKYIFPMLCNHPLVQRRVPSTRLLGPPLPYRTVPIPRYLPQSHASYIKHGMIALPLSNIRNRLGYGLPTDP